MNNICHHPYDPSLTLPLTSLFHIRLLDNSQTDIEMWDTFVRNHPESDIFHSFRFLQIIKDITSNIPILRCTPLHIMAFREPNILSGIMPLFHYQHPIFGNFLISPAFFAYGGVLAHDIDTFHAIAKYTEALALERMVRYAEIRSRIFPSFNNWHDSSVRHVCFRMKLADDIRERLFAIPRKKRANIRKALENNNLVYTNTTDIHTFYNLYAISMKKHGTPIHSINWYNKIMEQLGNNCNIGVVWEDNIPVAAVMSFFFKDSVYPYYVGALPSARRLHAVDYLYWKLMEYAIQRKANIFDFGKSRVGSGAANYKHHWGFPSYPLYRIYYSGSMCSTPPLPLYEACKKPVEKLWKQLPLSFSRLLGPLFAHGVV